MLDHLRAGNRAWAAEILLHDPEFFNRLARQQAPHYLWIGCSDSRVPANQITGTLPGDVFVHRNIANLVVHSDLNCLSVIQYAVEVLNIEHIIVCGHYGCGGVKAALEKRAFGLIDNWLRHVQDVMRTHASLLAAVEDEQERLDRLCELNVIEQVRNVCLTTLVQSAWERGQKLAVHGWIYSITDGLLQDVHMVILRPEQLPLVYETAVAHVAERAYRASRAD